jgi:hypothetical protein
MLGTNCGRCEADIHMPNTLENHGSSAVELHDSDVIITECETSSLVARFSPAYVHRSEGVAGTDPGTGWAQDALMSLAGTSYLGFLPEKSRQLSGGTVIVGGQVFDNIIPVPLFHVGEISILFVFEDGAEVRISARECRFELIGDPTFIEEVPGR